MKVPGVVDVFAIHRLEKPYGSIGGVAVVADNTWVAQQALEKVTIEWELGDSKNYDSEKDLKQLTKNVESPAKVVFRRGDTIKALEQATITHKASYQGGYLSHAPMEPNASVAWVKDDHCEIWASTQAPSSIQQLIGEYLGHKPEDIVVHVMMSGGAFGRKFKCDYVHEAVVLSKLVKAPVKLIWSREEDMRTGYYHSINAQNIEAGLDAKGNITSWLHRAAFPPIGSTFDPSVEQPQKDDMNGVINHPYHIQNLQVESGMAKAHTRIGWYRSVYAIFYSFGINIFTDELAKKAGKDPLDFYRQVFDNNTNPADVEKIQRSRGVLELAAKQGGWGRKLPANQGLGIAVHHSFRSYLAMVVHVEVEGNNIKVHQVDCAVDCGQILNKDGATAQMEGAVVMGLSFALRTQITFRNGAVVNSNFHDYPVLRLSEMPKVNVHFIDGDYPPTGLGEPGVPTFAPALLNAIYAASGKRYRSIPIQPVAV